MYLKSITASALELSSRMAYALRSRAREKRDEKVRSRVVTRSTSMSSGDNLITTTLPTTRRRRSNSNKASKVRRRFSTNTFRTAEIDELQGILLFKEQPRQFLLLFTVIAAVWYYSYTHDSDDMQQNVQTALLSSSFIFLAYCFLQTRDGILVRPHPGFWRIVHGCSVIYLILLAALSVQNVKSARNVLKILFPEVGEQSSPDLSHLNCEINARTLYQSGTSIWFFAHITGWWGKMCMFRDWRFCWVLSITFEFLEMSLQFIIPDFKECWWDSLIMDLFGANLVGMCLGKLTLHLLETTDYDWGNKGFVRRALNQFSPFSWSRYYWEVFSSFKRFAQVLVALFVTLMAELNAFFLLSTLNIPKESHINKYRLFLIFVLGIPAASEYYEFISDPNCWRVGQNAWMMCSIVCFEILIWAKFLPSILQHSSPLPMEVFVPIAAFAGMFILWTILFFLDQKFRKFRRHSWVLDALFLASFMPLLCLTKQWGY